MNDERTESQPTRFYRRIIKITARDSPNVRYAEAEARAGKEPTGRVIVPGVLPYWDYVKRRATWDPVRQSIGLDAEFWEGKETLLFPPMWLDRAHYVHSQLRGWNRKAEAMGIDPAEGGDKTAFCIVDSFGIIDLIALKTTNTTEVRKITKQLMREHNLQPERVCFDRGGGGSIHADTLRDEGFKVRTVGFGEPVTPEKQKRRKTNQVKTEEKENKYVYKNRRAEMFGRIREWIDPDSTREPRPQWRGFGIPAIFTELRRQLALFPLWYDGEGRLYLPQKEKKGHQREDRESTEPTLKQIIGCSPDEADSFAVALHALTSYSHRITIGGMPTH